MNYVDPEGLWRQVNLGYQAQSGDTLWGLAEKVFKGQGWKWPDLGYPYDLGKRPLQAGDIIGYQGGLIEYENGIPYAHVAMVVYENNAYHTPEKMPEPQKPKPPEPTASGGGANSNPGSVSSTSKPGNANSTGMSSGGLKPGGGQTHGFGLGETGNLPELPKPYIPPINVFFVYNKIDSGFKEQADYMAEKKYRDQINEFIYFTKIHEFVNEWNSLVDTRINDILLFLHGGAGKLYFDKEEMQYDDFSQLKELSIDGRAYLLACNGGTEYEGTTIAWKFSELLHGKRVRAVVDGKVYYRDWYQLFKRWPLTKEEGAYWADFYYVRGLTSRRKLQLEGGFYGKMPWPE